MAITATETKPELSKYELAEQLGHGGMATVYRAVDRRLGRDVAVKLIHPHLRGNPEVAARFVSEARAVAKLKHPNIVEVYDISDEAEAERYLVVELIEGPTLRELLAQHGRLPPEIAAALGLQLAAALRHAHDESIVHRDVKPENVLLQLPRRSSATEVHDEERHATVKLTDFGIAKLLDAHGVTSTGQVLGSPAHMAPEQIEGGKVGPRSDVFGLGVLLYEAMVGSLPFEGANPAQVLRRVLDGDHAPAVKLHPRVGAAFSAILDRALANVPDERFESVEQLAAALEAEMRRVGFGDAQAELDDFVGDPEAYVERYVERVVEGLAHAGETARRAGDVAIASACFNRALSYRPTDEDLLARVSAVSRGRWLKRAVVLGGLASALGAAAYAAWLAWPAERDVVASRPSPSPRAAVAVVERALPSAALGVAVASSAPSGTPAEHAKKAKRRKQPSLVAPRRVDQEPRKVRVSVVGNAKGGEVHIDGIRNENWYKNPTVELAAGRRHTFEFVHHNDGCCTSTRVTRVIEPGEEAENITLQVAYRSAILSVVGTPGTLNCSTLFSGGVEVPGKREIPMDRPDASGQCTFRPKDASASPSVETASLRAGQATTITVP